ncbi:MAG: CocE/NonD family hydrolase [Bacteroidales bacterium]|nr:CocE/NonD family hydrolase [Bacteroidales bacterium]
MERVEKINVLYRQGVNINNSEVNYPGFNPCQTIIKAGTIVKEGAPAISNDIIFDRDVAVELRDGAIIYVDIYRPANAKELLPAIIGWSPYGKRDGFITFDNFPFRAGVPQTHISGLDKYEGTDPDWWCSRGYAIVSPDARGAYRSEGKIHIWDKQEGRDGADLVEWIAAQSWSNGKVGMAGTSWLAISQWFVAAEQPPHLTAIAPWEGLDDAYRFCFFNGGISYTGFIDWLLANAPSPGGVEDVSAMMKKYPEFNEYWADKRAEVEKINIPVYAAVSWGGKLHHKGAMEGWHRLNVEDRWLRINNGSEWPDFYNNVSQEDLLRFFDCFLKGMENGWRNTPRVRLTSCDFANRDVANRAESEFPPRYMKDYELFLDGTSNRLVDELPVTSQISYNAESGQTILIATFDKATELTGYAKAHLFVEADGSDDADIFVKLEKLDEDGNVLGRILIPKDEPEYEKDWGDIVELAEGFGRAGFLYDGPWDRMRASRRHMTNDPREQLVYAHEKRLGKGEIVELILTFSATSIIFNPGESMRLVISGTNLTPFAFPGAKPLDLRNKGLHIIHTGKEYPSKLVLPLKNKPSVIIKNFEDKPTTGKEPVEEDTPRLQTSVNQENLGSIEGIWEFSIKTPVGKQSPEINFFYEDNILKGISTNPANGEQTPLEDIVLEENKLKWHQKVTKPVKGNSAFEMTVEGNAMVGKVKIGVFPKADVIAEKK